MLGLTALTRGYSAQKAAPGDVNDEGLTNYFNSAILPAADPTGKPLATLTARLTLLGHVLTPSNSAHGVVIYQVTRWGVEKVLPDLDAVRAFLIQIGGSA